MSAYLVLVAVVLAAAAVVLGAHAVRLLRVPREERVAARAQATAGRPAARDWEPLASRFLPLLLGLCLVACTLPLVLWGVALREPGVRAGAFWVGTLALVVLAVGALHSWRRGEVLR